MLVTGGTRYHKDFHPTHEDYNGTAKVHRYNQDQGWVEDLPDLTVGRRMHGCAAFTLEEEQVLRRLLRIVTCNYYLYFRFTLWLADAV